jgi:hypothetical protein
MAVCQNLVPLVNIKIAGKWMFIPLKRVLIGIDPYSYILSITILFKKPHLMDQKRGLFPDSPRGVFSASLPSAKRLIGIGLPVHRHQCMARLVSTRERMAK